MFYKKENNNWYTGKKIHLPSGEVLTEDNKIKVDGWEWHDEPPQEYIEWLNKQNELKQ
jgi:hypothetical protein